MFSFELQRTSRDTRGRRGRIETPHGAIDTPMFMPVGTQGTVKGIAPDELVAAGAQIVLANTYHLFLRPGHERVQRLGGLHRFMGWERPILTDSGGYQVFSLADLRSRFTEEGVEFQSHLDGGARHLLTPELAIAIQEALGSDIMMVLDECTPYPADEATARTSMELSLRWAKRCLDARTTDAALFGIVQGGTHAHLRREYIDRLLKCGMRNAECGIKTQPPTPHSELRTPHFEGYAIGGLSVGEPIPLMYEMTAVCTETLPAEKPRYLMGVGTPEDLVECIDRGIDLFDCVMPTRHARHGSLFTRAGDLTILNARFADDPAPVEEGCPCPCCRHFSRAYLHHLMKAKELLGARLATLHNLQFYLDLIGRAHLALDEDRYPEFKKNFLNSRKELHP